VALDAGLAESAKTVVINQERMQLLGGHKPGEFLAINKYLRVLTEST
jgi:hypothetical protein